MGRAWLAAVACSWLVGCATSRRAPDAHGEDAGASIADAGGVDAGRGDVDFPPWPDACGDPARAPGDPCTVDFDCNDACFCNGLEACLGGRCVAAESPIDCDDGVDCSEDRCDEEEDRCVHTLPRGC